MVSAIDGTIPVDGVPAAKSDLRANFEAARVEIEALQDQGVDIYGALGLTVGSSSFPALGGDNTPVGASTLVAILLALDAAITAAAGSGGGGPITLSSITDILSPDEDVRSAFQESISAATEDQDFAFNLSNHGGKLITVDNSTNSVNFTLPDPATISRADGYLCSVIPASGVNFASITGPANTLRYQGQRNGDSVTQTTVFVGLSRSSGFRSFVNIYKDGPVYSIVGPCRLAEVDDLRFNAAGIVSTAMLAAGLLNAAAFPALLDLGGTKQAGGARSVQIDIAGAHTFLQSNSGKTLVHTGGGTETWDVPTLTAGTEIEIENEGGAITYNIQGGQSVRGGLTQAPDTSAVIKWLTTGTVVLLGTS